MVLLKGKLMAKQGIYSYDWPRPMLTVDAVVFLRDRGDYKVLLIKRGLEPFKGKWAFPGGFVEMDEELDDAIGRELLEETGLMGVKLTQMHTFGGIGRDPRGRTITVTYTGVADANNAEIQANDDAAEAKWFNIDDLPKLAFDHGDVAAMAIELVTNESQ